MGIFIIIGPSLGAGFFSEPHPLPSARESLRVMTYNIHQGYNTEGKINPWEILEPITRVDPHIIALQESDMNRITSTNVDIVRWLAHKLDMYSYFGPGTNHQIYGVSLLSTFPLTNTDVYFLSSIEDQRVLVRGDIEYKGYPLSIYVVHMGLSEEDRTTQTAQILNILSDNSQDSILLGDFNSTPDSLQMNQFFMYYRDAWAASGHPADDPSSYTFSSLFPEKHIDYILIPKEWEHRVIRCVILSDIYASDHLPVWAEIV
ncbi:MAG: endonuclease/exonuclease/phosphatase family protein [Candidatus Thorarchaeota archaeon]|jgi:endonuclease/exonuclease/phosphatase family metal-dependent hydrolase